MQNRILLDANAVLRFLLRDIEEQAARARAAIITGRCRITLEVMAEVVYVLGGPYKIPRPAIADMIKSLLSLSNDLVEKREIVSFGITLFAASKLDFVDCLLAGYQSVEGCEIFTFDKALAKTLSHP